MSGVWSFFAGSEPPGSRRSTWLLTTLLGAVLALAVAAFWHFATATAHRINIHPQNPKRIHDQTIYLEHAAAWKRDGVRHTFPRQHMPGYGALLAPFMRADEGITDFFWRGKTIAITLSLAAWLALIPVLRLALPWTESILIFLAAGFLLFVFRAGYYQPELLFNTLFLLSLILLLKMLAHPRLGLAVAAGAAFAATHALKASMSAALGLFIAASAVRFLMTGLRGQWRLAATGLAIAAVVPAVFLSLLSPYLVTSKQNFGSYFFSAHTRYHMWVDTHEASRALVAMKVESQRPGLDETRLRNNAEDYEANRPHFDDWREHGLPSPARYFREHSLRQVAATWLDTADRQLDRIKRDYLGLTRFLHGLVGALIAACVLNWRETARLVRRHWLVIGTYLAFVGGYFVVYVFYAKIGMGPRLILTLAMPVIFGLAFALWQAGRELKFAFPSRSISFRNLTLAGLAAILAHSASRALTDHIYWVLGGQ